MPTTRLFTCYLSHHTFRFFSKHVENKKRTYINKYAVHIILSKSFDSEAINRRTVEDEEEDDDDDDDAAQNKY